MGIRAIDWIRVLGPTNAAILEWSCPGEGARCPLLPGTGERWMPWSKALGRRSSLRVGGPRKLGGDHIHERPQHHRP